MRISRPEMSRMFFSLNLEGSARHFRRSFRQGLPDPLFEWGWALARH